MPPLLDLNSVIMAIDANKVAASMEIAKAILDSPSSEVEPSTVITMGIEDPRVSNCPDLNVMSSGPDSPIVDDE